MLYFLIVFSSKRMSKETICYRYLFKLQISQWILITCYEYSYYKRNIFLTFMFMKLYLIFKVVKSLYCPDITMLERWWLTKRFLLTSLNAIYSPLYFLKRLYLYELWRDYGLYKSVLSRYEKYGFTSMLYHRILVWK